MHGDDAGGCMMRVRVVAGLLGLCVLGAPLVAQEAGGACGIRGRVVVAGDGAAVAGASVWLERSDGDLVAGRATRVGGAFAFELDDCRPVVLHVEMLGFQPAERAIVFRGNADVHTLEVALTRAPLAVEELRVEVPRSARLSATGFYARKAWVESTGKDYGEFLDPVEVAERAAAQHSLGEISLSSRIRFVYGGCTPSVYVDGRLIPGADGRHYWDRVGRAIRPEEVEGIEVYRALSAAVPEEFRDYASLECAAVVVWTKREGP